MSGSRKLSTEEVNGPRDFVPEFLKSLDDGLVLERPKLLERYADNRLALHIHVRLILLPELDSKDFCAVVGGFRAHRWRRDADDVKRSSIASDLDGLNVDARQDDDEQSVFVSVVDGLNDPERVRLEVGVLLCRLQALNDGGCGRGDALYVSPITGSYEFVGRVTDRELVGTARCPTVGQHELRDEMVKRRTQLVNGLASDHCEPQRQVWANCLNNCLAGLVIMLGDSVIDIVSEKRSDLRVQILDVLVGPLNLGADAIEGMRHEVNSLSERSINDRIATSAEEVGQSRGVKSPFAVAGLQPTSPAGAAVRLTGLNATGFNDRSADSTQRGGVAVLAGLITRRSRGSNPAAATNALNAFSTEVSSKPGPSRRPPSSGADPAAESAETGGRLEGAQLSQSDRHALIDRVSFVGRVVAVGAANGTRELALSGGVA